MAEENNNPGGLPVSSLYNPTIEDLQVGMDPLTLLEPKGTSFVPPLPNGTPIPPQVNNQITGDYFSGPAPGANPNVTAAKGTGDFAKAAIGALHDNNWATDPYKYGRTYSYGSGQKAMNFDRYYNYRTFDKLGFSPYRDNEAYYTEKGSWWDDFLRMGGQWGNLVWSGAKSVWGDEKVAQEEMAKGMSIGMSTRGGVGGWVNNFALNSAYTIGILGEITAENMALAAMEVGSFGLATPEVAAAAAARASSFGKLWRGVVGVSDMIRELRDVNKARELFKGAKLGEKALDFAKWVNPFERTFETTRNILTNKKGFDQLDGLAKAAIGFGDFYRDLREINVAHAEARLEGESAAVEYQDAAVDEYYKKNGFMPNEEESRAIFETAQSVKGAVTLANDFTIYLTNKIAFHDLFEGIRPGSKLSKIFLDGFKDTLVKTPATAYKAATDAAYKLGTKGGMKAVGDFMLKSSYSPLSRKYFLGNLGEALQESSQEVIQKGALDYYRNIQSDPSQVGFYNAINSIGKGIGAQFTSQGLDTFLQGYLMGTIIQGGTAALTSAGNRIFTSKEKRDLKKAEYEENKSNMVNAINHTIKNAHVYGRGASLSDALAEIKQGNLEKRKRKEMGDEKGMHDMGDEVNINYLDLVVRGGNLKLVTDFIDEQLQLDDEALLQSANVSDKSQASEVRERLNKFKERAAEYKARYDRQQKIAPNPHNPDLFDPKKHPEAYSLELSKFNAYEAMMRDIRFANEDYFRISDRLKNIYTNATGQNPKFKSPIQFGPNKLADANSTYYAMLVDDQRRNDFLKTVNAQIDVYLNGTAEQKREAKDLMTLRDMTTQWTELVQGYLTEINAEKKAEIKPEEYTAAKERSRKREGAVVKDKKTNEEYTVTGISGNKIVVKTATGTFKTINKDKVDVIKDSELKPSEFVGVEGDELSQSIARLYDQYTQIVKHIARMSKGEIFDEQLNESFRQIKDYFHLDLDRRDLVTTINTLADPTYQARLHGIYTEVMTMARQQRAQDILTALAKFEKLKGDNAVLNRLFDIGVRILPEDIKNVKNFNLEGVEFYDVTGKEYVDYKDPKYIEILDIIEDQAEKEGIIVRGKPIIEEGTTDEAYKEEHYARGSRTKFAKDQRVLQDIATQYGFDPKKETELNAIDVLKLVIASELSTAPEKLLARRLLTVVDPTTTIKFVNNLAKSGTYDKEANQVSIDARYSSNDYAAGKNGSPIETSILHHLVNGIVAEKLESDTVFMDKITRLREYAAEAQKRPEIAKEYGPMPLFGTMDNMRFISEVLTSDTFRAMLSNVQYEVSGKPSSAWEEFTNAIKEFLSKVLNIKIGSTLLDEALYVITTKIDGGGPIAEEKGAPKAPVTPKTEYVTQDTSYEEIKASEPEFLNKLYKYYTNLMQDKGIDVPATLEELEASPEQLDDFKGFIADKTDITLVQMFTQFNKQKAAASGTTTKAGVFTPTTPYGTPTGEPVTTATSETEEELDSEEVFNGLLDMYTKVNTSEDLEEWKGMAYAVLSEGLVPDMTAEDIEQLISDKIAELNKSVKFEDLKHGTPVSLKDSDSVWYVYDPTGVNEKVGAQVTLLTETDFKNNDMANAITLDSDNYLDKIDKVITDLTDQAPEKPGEAISKEDIKESNIANDLTNSTDAISNDEVDSAITEAENQSIEDISNEFADAIKKGFCGS